MFESTKDSRLLLQLAQNHAPQAMAVVKGDAAHAGLHGTVSFYELKGGVLVVANISGLPRQATPCDNSVFGFHIHAGGMCSGNSEDPFADAGAHYNPRGCPHPEHAGDLPPLFANDGNAWSAVVTNRFSTQEIIGKTVIIHSHPDDFHTQPSGNSGMKIACGVIHKK